MRRTEFKPLASSAAIVLSISIMLLIHGDLPTKVSCADVGNKTDMLALLAFKDGITDDPLQVLNSWNQSLHFCRWKGVTCGRRHQRVIMLDLASQKLSGSMSPSIGNLSFLKIIDLSNNSFTGEVPPETSRLFRLQQFAMVNNSFEGQIPVNLSSCSRLSVLALDNNKFTGHVPSELGSLTKLELLSAAKNYLTGTIPSSLGNLSALEELWLPINQLDGSIPDSLGEVKTLIALGLGSNKLSGSVPHSVYNLSYLTRLSLANNQFKGSLPRDLGHKNCLPYLEILRIWGNQFSGTLPASLSNASNLRMLELDYNRFVRRVPIDFGNMKKLYRIGLSGNNLGTGEVDDLSFITSLTNCSHLNSLTIADNNFGGVLPNSLANLSTTLVFLLIQKNQISGNIPQGIGNLIGLEAVAMYYNRLRGAIPETIGNLLKLQQAGFGKNKLSGRIPSSIGNLAILSWLYIEENSLEGSIPPSLGNCRNLQLLHLYGNALTGNIPREVVGLASLSISLNLSRNHLSGPIPLEVGSLKNLAELDVSHNKLSGEIPSSLGACTSLERLYMNDNSLRGIIPNSLSSLRAIEDLDLSLNNLTGELPKSFGTLALLRKLNLSFNDFYGEVPIGGAFANTSEVSLVGNEKLCGGIPDLGLPKCFANESRKPRMPFYLKVIIFLAGGLLGLALVVSSLLIYWKKKPKSQPPSASLSVDPLMNLSYGDIFRATDGFSSLNLIGMGSFGSVYKGVLEPEKQIVAVKVLNLQNKGATRSFIAECEALRNIRHRNLVKVITACSSIDCQGNDFKALVYEFMPNGSLETWLHPLMQASDVDHVEPRTLSLSQRLNILTDVAAALDYLHNHSEMPIIHRDLKPGNILLDNDMTAHVSDFGLAKTTAQSQDELLQSQSSSSCIKGTIGYTPPEYGIGSAATTQGDVYSFGILVLEVFTGKRPGDHNMQADGSNLQKMVAMALPEAVTEIIDHALVAEVERKGTIARKCLAAVLELGVVCSVESPRNRMDVSDVANELSKIKDLLLKRGYERNP